MRCGSMGEQTMSARMPLFLLVVLAAATVAGLITHVAFHPSDFSYLSCYQNKTCFHGGGESWTKVRYYQVSMYSTPDLPLADLHSDSALSVKLQLNGVVVKLDSVTPDDVIPLAFVDEPLIEHSDDGMTVTVGNSGVWSADFMFNLQGQLYSLRVGVSDSPISCPIHLVVNGNVIALPIDDDELTRLLGQPVEEHKSRIW